ncbi:snRNA-activating protein complex subunit 1 isoform X2 [Zootoca vivipara]|uniref:snRNA-activating protein complex subunit 1 isoform X2 n=1 Tax=Zootoca vivipara TaxID=8524 RepID=UPI00158FD550|nr:snRNA-activating protein complex subunit 1 isoform X2 [Zootoca vivipara]
MSAGWPGLKTDCEAMLSSFQQAESVRFEDFASLWREMRFHTIFYGKIRTPEQIKFTKEALALVWPYCFPPYTFQVRVGALYLLYGLYNTQLGQPKQKIRVALKDWAEVMKFQQELLDAQYYDAAYVFRRLRMDRAFHFTAMPKFLSFRTKKNMQEKTETRSEFRDPEDRVAMLKPHDFLEEAKNIHDHYQKMKCLVSEDQSQPDKALNLIKDDFVDNFKNIILEHQEWQKKKAELALAAVGEEATNAKEGPSQGTEGFERARALADIKSKSYSSVVQASKSRRHRQVKLESSESTDRGKSKSPRAKKASKSLQPRRKNETRKSRGTLQLTEEQSAGTLSMPVIAEDDEEEDTDHSSDEDFMPSKRKRAR